MLIVPPPPLRMPLELPAALHAEPRASSASGGGTYGTYGEEGR